MSDTKGNGGMIAKTVAIVAESTKDLILELTKSKRIIKEAEAEVQANMIKTKGDFALQLLKETEQARADERIREQQQNVDSIIFKSIEHIDEDKSTETPDRDWLNFFFKSCDHVSDEDAQELWARILAGEINSKGSFSLRALDTLRTLSRVEADMITKFSSYCLYDPNMNRHFTIYIRREDEKNYNISFGSLSILDDIGIINFDSNMYYSIGGFDKEHEVRFSGETFVINFPDSSYEEGSKHRLEIGNITLTNVGEEIISICQPEQNLEYLDYIKTKLSIS